MSTYLRNPHPVDLSDFFGHKEGAGEDVWQSERAREIKLSAKLQKPRRFLRHISKATSSLSEKLFSIELKNIKF